MTPARRSTGLWATAIALLGLHCGGATPPHEKAADHREANPPPTQSPATRSTDAEESAPAAAGSSTNSEPIQCRTSGPRFPPRNDADRKLLKRIDDIFFNSYVQMLPDEAEKRLRKALSDCETTCSDAALAKGHMYMGLLYGSAMGDLDRARDEFVLALRLAPNVLLDRDLATPETVAAFEKACKDMFPAGAD